MEKIARYVIGMDLNSFQQDDRTIDAVVRNLEIIGEAANRLPESFKLQYAEIPWRKIVGLRNRIVHEYFGVDVDIVWSILQSDLPALRPAFEKIREELSD
jgi:hypothetical protein